MIRPVVLTSTLEEEVLKTKEDIAIQVVSSDNKSLAFNLVGSDSETTEERDYIPNSVLLSNNPLEGFRVISRISCSEKMGKDLLEGRVRVIANSLEDKLKSYMVINQLSRLV